MAERILICGPGTIGGAMTGDNLLKLTHSVMPGLVPGICGA
jgi:hypothetical protein